MSLLIALAQLVLLDPKTVVDILAAASIPGEVGLSHALSQRVIRYDLEHPSKKLNLC